ncbi:hypothetical protein M422DRAFT_266121 [Sphaerobolus stellatus SS14]|uniref:Uncharacterized protein n=1 Tax=Sphaerobolus stellatus (strain SS14) TaxID=990650 RepID=A0A0C9TPZ7_SPHS4|nr:hypothetical protein M422DRAFT_266121 [Sphaerobolus stellatus SS14]
MSRYDGSPSTLFPSLISRMAPPGMSGSSLSPRDASSILGVSTLTAKRRDYDHYATLRKSSNKLLFLVLQSCPSGMDDYARCWNTLVARRTHPGSAPLTRALACNTGCIPP